MSTGFYWDERTMWHAGGNYAFTVPLGGLVQPLAAGGLPESPETKRRLKNLMDVTGLTGDVSMTRADPAADIDLLRVHPQEYLSNFKVMSDAGGGEIGHHAPFAKGGYEIAALSAGLAIGAVRGVLDGTYDNAYALCRPPGHHAYRDRASGFCFFNNAAIAAEALRPRYPRIAILDFDTHHGDGTQAIYFGDAATFVGSTHTDPTAYYPFYCGYADETGLGDGAGTNLNVPLAPGADDAAFLGANDRILSAAADFAPDAIIISAGWDAHRDDPLSRLDVSSAAFAELGLRYGALGLPTVIVQEGGYSLSAIEDVAPRFLAALEEGRP